MGAEWEHAGVGMVIRDFIDATGERKRVKPLTNKQPKRQRVLILTISFLAIQLGTSTITAQTDIRSATSTWFKMLEDKDAPVSLRIDRAF